MRRLNKRFGGVCFVLLFAISGFVQGCGDPEPVTNAAPAQNVAAPQPRPNPAAAQEAAKAAEEEVEEKKKEVVVQRFRPARDPFKSVFAEKRSRARPDGTATHPLQQFGIGQLNLLGIIWGIAQPVGLVSTPGGDEYIVKAGTPVGTGDGKVVAILPDRVVIVERYYDYRGQLQTEKYEMVLANEGN